MPNPSDRWFSLFVSAIRAAPKAQYSIPSLGQRPRVYGIGRTVSAESAIQSGPFSHAESRFQRWAFFISSSRGGALPQAKVTGRLRRYASGVRRPSKTR